MKLASEIKIDCPALFSHPPFTPFDLKFKT